MLLFYRLPYIVTKIDPNKPPPPLLSGTNLYDFFQYGSEQPLSQKISGTGFLLFNNERKTNNFFLFCYAAAKKKEKKEKKDKKDIKESITESSTELDDSKEPEKPKKPEKSKEKESSKEIPKNQKSIAIPITVQDEDVSEIDEISEYTDVSEVDIEDDKIV